LLFDQFKKEVRNLKRLEEIVGVFVKYGFGYIIQQLPFHPLVSKSHSDQDIFNLPFGVRLRKVFEELGPTFIKLGQMLSLRPDILPFDVCKELEHLQDDVPPSPFDPIKEILEKEFDKPLQSVFDHFPETPIASASLAQVYEVKRGHKKLIVKVQKPHVKEIIGSDLEILAFLVNLIEKHVKEARIYGPNDLMEEFKSYILRELDFTNELVNLEKFRVNFREDPRIYFPAAYRELCTDKVLVIEEIKGIKISELDKIRDAGLHKKKIAKIFVDCMLRQMFVDGFFHGDPHPGNVFVLDDGRISFIDYGIVGRIDEDSKFALVNVLLASAEKDVDRIMDILRESKALGNADEKKLKFSLELLLDKYHGRSLEEFRMNEFLKDMTRLMYENKVRLLSDHFILVKTLAIVESVSKTLEPEVNFTVEVKRLADVMIRDEYSVKRIGRKIGKVTRDLFSLIQDLPEDLIEILNEVRKGRLKIGFEHLNLENMIAMLDKLSNRLSFSLIIAALIISSSLLIQTNSPSFFGSSRQLGVIGFIVAGVLGCWLLFKIIRSGKF